MSDEQLLDTRICDLGVKIEGTPPEKRIAQLERELDAKRIARLCKRVYRALDMSGYGRVDLRQREDGQIFVLEANANPNLEYGEDFAESAETAGISYEALLARIINLGLRYQAPWQQ